MVKAATAFLMIFMLLFCCVGVPVFADVGAGGHVFELVDLDCQAEEKSDSGEDKRPPASPAGHVDHHHCSAAIPHSVASVAKTELFTSDAFLHLAVRSLTSYQTAPPTQPPSA